MIAGIFGGDTLDTLKTQKEKIAQLKIKLDGRVAQAIADRTAAIRELTNELTELKGL